MMCEHLESKRITIRRWHMLWRIFVVQLLNHVQLFVIPWTAAWQASLSFTISWSLLRFSPLSHWCYLTISSSAISFCIKSFPHRVLFFFFSPMSWLFASGGQSVRTSASASVLPMKIQGCFPLAFTGLISLRSKRLSRVFSIPGRQRLWKPPGSCFRPCGPRASERKGPGREPVPCRPALLVQLACPPHPHRGLLSRQMRHFINCVLNTCFKFVKKKKKRVFSSTIIQRRQFFSAQPSLWSSSHICTWLLEKP